MDNQKTYPDVIDRIKSLLMGTFGSSFKQYYEGDPVSIPKADLPCIILEKINTRIEPSATGTDQLAEEINIRVVLNQADDIGTNDSDDLTAKKLRKIVEARDPSTGFFQTDTIMYSLRTNISLGGAAIDNTIDVSYDVNPRPESMVTSEAVISIIVTERVTVPNRI